MRLALKSLGGFSLDTVSSLGRFASFVGSTIKNGFYPLLSYKLLIAQIEFVGNRSFTIILLAGSMVGGIFGFQLADIFATFGAESMIGASTGFALSRELAPIVGSFLVTARAGSAMAAEIASMRINEQIDAMRVMAVNPYAYLTAPRVFAATLAMPLLCILFVFSGVLASYIIGTVFYDIDVADFQAKLEWIMSAEDISLGMQKSAFFGFIFSSVGCYQGFYARGGAKGVGKATTKAVVISYVSILVVDFLITYLQFKGFSFFPF